MNTVQESVIQLPAEGRQCLPASSPPTQREENDTAIPNRLIRQHYLSPEQANHMSTHRLPHRAEAQTTRQLRAIATASSAFEVF